MSDRDKGLINAVSKVFLEEMKKIGYISSNTSKMLD